MNEYFFPDEIPGCFSKLPRILSSYIQLSRPHHFMAGVIPCLCGVQFSENTTNVLYWYFIFVIGAFLVLGAGETINDIIDRHIDAKYSKTMARPIPSGRVSIVSASVYFFIQLFLAFLIWLELPNSVKLMSLCLFFMICVYPFFKRFAIVTQIYLGIIPGLSALLPYYIFENKISIGIVFLILALSMICIIFDTVFEYAEFFNNPKTRIKSIAILFRSSPKKYLFICTLLYMIFLILAGIFENKGILFFIGGMLSYIFMLNTILKTDLQNAENCRNSFLKLQFTNLIIFISIVLSSI